MLVLLVIITRFEVIESERIRAITIRTKKLVMHPLCIISSQFSFLILRSFVIFGMLLNYLLYINCRSLLTYCFVILSAPHEVFNTFWWKTLVMFLILLWSAMCGFLWKSKTWCYTLKVYLTFILRADRMLHCNNLNCYFSAEILSKRSWQ